MNGQCPKCGATDLKESEARMSGGGLSAIFELESKKYDTITCNNCGYTEFYSRDRSTAEQVADFFLG